MKHNALQMAQVYFIQSEEVFKLLRASLKYKIFSMASTLYRNRIKTKTGQFPNAI